MKLPKRLSSTPRAYQVDISNGLANMTKPTPFKVTPILYGTVCSLQELLVAHDVFASKPSSFKFRAVWHDEDSMVSEVLKYRFEWCSAIRWSGNAGGHISETKTLAQNQTLQIMPSLLPCFPTHLPVHANWKNMYNANYKVNVNMYCFSSLVSGLRFRTES